MKCPRCQHDNPQGARFCEQCATPLARTCSNCGTALSAAAKFCHACAHPIAAEAGTPRRSPDSYTPKHLAAKILTSKAALEGERKLITVLFADLKGSMELLANRDPEDARKILDPVLEQMMDAVHRYEGTVNQVMGDGIMALFGAPLAHEDHAVRACYAALRMQERIKAREAELRRTHGVNIQIRVGLNSGEVVVRAVGSDLRMDYSAVGQTTHLAARMEQLAAPGGIRLTADTLRLAEAFVEVTPLGPLDVKGFPTAVEVFELRAASSSRTRVQAVATRGLTKFVGRAPELDCIGQALESAEAGAGRMVALVGEPGVGKSRIVWEITHSSRTEGWRLVASGAVSYGKAIAYGPVIGLLRDYFQADREDAGVIRETIADKVSTLDPELSPILPALFALLNVTTDDPEWEALESAQRRQRTLDAVSSLLLRASQVRPLVLVFEDLHWIDAESQALLENLVERLPSARLLLMVSFRPEYQHDWAPHSWYTEVRVTPLPREGAEDLLRALLGDHPTLGPLKRVLIDRTGRNPLFIEESVRTLVEVGALSGDRGAYRAAVGLSSIQMPATVQAILAARIDRLPPDEKAMLQTAAVIGKNFEFSLLRALVDIPEDMLAGGLAHLRAAEFIYETSLFPDLEYTFKHALTHEVAYGSLLQDRRRTLHARIVETIEQVHSDRLVDHIDDLGRHALRGEVWPKAVTYLRQAGARAHGRSANAAAAELFEQALRALSHLPETRARSEQAVDLRFDLYSAYNPLGALARVLGYLRDARTIAEGIGDRARLGRVSANMSHCYWWMGQGDEAVEAGDHALAIATAIGDLSLEVLARVRLASALSSIGDFRRAVDIFQRNIERLDGDLRHERFGIPGLPSVTSRSWMGQCLAVLGDFRAAGAVVEEAVRIAEAADHPYSLAQACWGFGVRHLMQGNIGAATSALERSVLLCREGDFTLLLPQIAPVLGQAYGMSGRPAEALALLQQSVEMAASIELMAVHPSNLIALSTSYLSTGKWHEAMRSIQMALDLTRTHRQRGTEARALRTLGEIHWHQNPPAVEAAEASHGAALTLAADLGMRPLVAHCHLSLGRLYRRTERHEKAVEHLEGAVALLRAMGMTSWLERAEVELKTLAHNC